MRIVAMLVGALLASVVAAQSNIAVHLVDRCRTAVDGGGATYVDTYSDGTVKQEVVPWPSTPTAVHLVSTNDAGQAWRMDYAATYVVNGTVVVRTNASFQLKPRDERMMPKRPEFLPPNPVAWQDRAAEIASNRPTSAFAQISARHADQMTITTQTMQRVPKVTTQNIVNGKLVSQMSDGRVVTNEITRMVTARVNIPTPAAPASGGVPAGAVAGAAAAALAAGIFSGRASKKSTGVTTIPVDPSASADGTPTT